MHTRRTAVAATLGAAGWLLAAAVAWACVPGGEAGTLSVSPPQARAGEQIKLSGTAGSKSPVSIHLASGTLLTQVPVAPDEHGEGYQFTATVTLPTGTPLGSTSLVASQDNVKWGAPLVVVAQPAAVVPGSTGSAEAETAGSRDVSTTMIAVSAVAVLVLAALTTVIVRGRRRSSPIEETPSEELVGSR